MRIVSWNCNGALRKKEKIEKLRELKADVYVIQECEDPNRAADSTYTEWASGSLWDGGNNNNKNKGLGVFASGMRLARLDWPVNDLELFIPLTVNHLTILAVWAKPGNSHTYRYIGQVWKYIQAHGNKLARGKSIVIGDLNSNSCWDFRHRSSSHTDVVRDLSNFGLESVYHRQKEEPRGEEKQPTFFRSKRLDRPYHIDYAFTSEDIIQSASISIGKPDEWLKLSDHMPVILDIAAGRYLTN